MSIRSRLIALPCRRGASGKDQSDGGPGDGATVTRRLAGDGASSLGVWSEVSPGMIAFSRARVRVCHGVCVHKIFMERGAEKDLPAAAAAAVTPAGHAGADGLASMPRRRACPHTPPVPSQNLFCPSLPSHTHAFTPIVALPCTCFHAHRGPPMHSLPCSSISGCCPSIHSISRPSQSSNTQACAPVAVLA